MLKLKIQDKDGKILGETSFADRVSLVYEAEYNDGDIITVEADSEMVFCKIKLEDSMMPSIVLVKGALQFHIPPADNRTNYSPKSFSGAMHLIVAEVADDDLVYDYRCLTFNPYDTHQNKNSFPHVYANVETRNEAVFAARNAIDGIYENCSHGIYPYQSWGINRDPNAMLPIDLGTEAVVDKVVITLRADFPHDNYWEKATMSFSDDTTEVFPLVKTEKPQSFDISPRTITSARFYELIMAEGESPFPALTQIELWGKIIKK